MKSFKLCFSYAGSNSILSQESFRFLHNLSVLGKWKCVQCKNVRFERLLILTDSPPFPLPVFQNTKTGGLHQGPQITHNKVIIVQETEQLLWQRGAPSHDPPLEEVRYVTNRHYRRKAHTTASPNRHNFPEGRNNKVCRCGTTPGFLMRDKLQTHETFMVSWLTKQKNEGVFCEGNQ